MVSSPRAGNKGSGGSLDELIKAVGVLARSPTGLPMTAQHFQAGGVDITADQLADQIIASMQAVADGRSVEEGAPFASK